ncbi:MAG: NUDIX domain-containing protein [Nanoarchaeota archaeon]
MVNYDKNKAHYVVVTGILIKDGKYLIAKRAEWEKAFPGKWTVPGGKIEVMDYVMKKKDTNAHWYNIIENALKREVFEEVGLGIENICYVTSLVYLRDDEIPCLIISLYGIPVGEEIKLCRALTEYKWASLDELKNYDLVEGLYEEFVILDEHLTNGNNMIWKKKD